jgi:mono/diheme cytochrome c family protein
MRRPLLVLAVALLAAGCGGGETVTPLPETVEGTVPAETGGGATTIEPGDPEAGKEVFTTAAQPTCGSCHTYGPAGTTATVGPNLDEALSGKDAAFVLESIVNPDAEIAPGFAAGVMPKDYGDKLSEKQLADLVAFLLPTS